MSHQEQKMIREAGTPALLCFMPEELPTSCRITSLINMKNLGAGKTCIFFHNSYLSQYVLEGKHPSSMPIRHIPYKNLSVKKKQQNSLISKRDYNNILAFGNVGSIVQSCFNVLFGERWKIIFDDFLLRYISSKQFKNLPNHDSCAFESRGSSTNLAVCNDVVVDSHEIFSDYEVFKDFVSFEEILTSVYISNISYYISNYCGLMPTEVVSIKSRILEIEERLKVLEAME